MMTQRFTLSEKWFSADYMVKPGRGSERKKSDNWGLPHGF